ncbi:MAG: hypothetical protein COB08_019435 [Rhodobacteraceae bacterium]|nr:hypothetical protein [Paracoccaceae bacterium]
MFITKSVALMGAALFLGACVDTTSVSVTPSNLDAGLQQSAISSITHDFRDPEAARTRGVRAYRTALGDTMICGEVNGVNAYGAYIGYRAFYVRIRDGAIRSKHIDDSEYYFPASSACNQAAAGSILLPSTDVTP